MQFQLVQQAFIAHIKDPSQNPRPADVAPERMVVYNELFFNNVQGFVSSAFPVLRSLYSAEQWQALNRLFFCQYQCTSPYFLHIAEHFLHFLQQDYTLQATDPQFMLELAHYEWAELYLATKQVDEREVLVAADEVTSSGLGLTERAMILAYPYPVHTISSDNQPKAAGEVQCYLLYRNQDDDVKFVLVNQITAALLQTLQQQPGATLKQLVQSLSALLPQFSHEQLLQGAEDIMRNFAAKGVLVSFQAS